MSRAADWPGVPPPNPRKPAGARDWQADIADWRVWFWAGLSVVRVVSPAAAPAVPLRLPKPPGGGVKLPLASVVGGVVRRWMNWDDGVYP